MAACIRPWTGTAISIAGIALICLLTPALGDDAGVQTQRPQFRTPTENARASIGADEVEGPTIFEGIPTLNPIDAARDTLRDRYGFYLHGLYLGDPYANLGGGLKRGATYSGRLDIELDVDAAKAAAIQGGTLHANMFQIHGRDLSEVYVGNFLTVNDIAALPSTRLYELWYEQKFGDKLSIRAGQQGVDVEFLTSNYAANFINASFGWPGPPSQDLPDGGPAYPLATPAVRVKVDPTENLSILGAVFDGEPAGPCVANPQICDPSGLNFRVTDPPLVLLESQYHYNRGKNDPGLPGTLKLGAYGHFGSFFDQRLRADGLPPALGNGIAHRLAPNGAFYAVVDQQIYSLAGPDDPDGDGGKGEDDAEKGIGVFGRLIGASPDSNSIDLYVDAGISSLGLIPGRPEDLIGAAFAFAKISSVAAAAGQSADFANGVAAPIRSFEAVIELTYQAQIIPGISIQPTFQYYVHPGGNVVNPSAGKVIPIQDAKVFGVTAAVRF